MFSTICAAPTHRSDLVIVYTLGLEVRPSHDG